jgi:hypothetical protein
MKKFQLTWAFIWMMAMMAMLFVLAANVFGQDTTNGRDATHRVSTQPCPCDSLFVRRVNFRIERQLDVNGTVWSALRDQKEINAVLESRLDSLRALVRTWQERQQQPKKRK